MDISDNIWKLINDKNLKNKWEKWETLHVVIIHIAMRKKKNKDDIILNKGDLAFSSIIKCIDN